MDGDFIWVTETIVKNAETGLQVILHISYQVDIVSFKEVNMTLAMDDFHAS